jgi:pimeloyl-ACP methyl ester carboxylesterase
VAKSQINQLREEQMQFSDGVDDAIGWIRWLRQQGFRKIYVAGHSEGSLIGLSAAQTEKISGFISIAGVGRPIDAVLREQFAAGGGPDSLKKLAGRYLDTLLMGQRIVKPHPLLLSVFRPSVQPYMISWLRYNPQTLMRTLNCRALIVQGTNDLQVKETDAQLLAASKPEAKLVIVEQMNHVLKKIDSPVPAANIASYSNPKLPVMIELVTAITQFVKGKFN